MTSPIDLEGFKGEGAAPLIPGEGASAFARGTPAKHPYAVLYQGEHETVWDGTGVAVRLHARALAATGVPVVLRSFSNVVIGASGVPEPVHAVGLPEPVKREVGALRDTSAAVTVPLIKHGVIRSEAHVRRMVVPPGAIHHDPEVLLALRQSLYQSTILYTVWERDRIDPGVAVQLGRVAQCWVPCEQNRELLVAAGVARENVRVVPHPYDPAAPLCRLIERRSVPTRRFYSIGRWEARKGQHELLGAFLRAFLPGEATLVIKYTGGQWDCYPSPEQSVEHWLTGNRAPPAWTRETFTRNVQLIGERLAADQILKLHFTNNIYVSAGHGEAWCLPAFDAKVAGNRLVHVGFGGTADFASAGDIAVPWQLGPVHASYPWEPGARWAHYDSEDLAMALRAVEPPPHYERPPQFEERFSMRAVGEQMLHNVLEAAESCVPEAARYLREQTKR